MNPAQACLDVAALRRLLAGDLSAAGVDAISAHLEGCAGCVHLVRTLPDDLFADLAVDTVEGVQRNTLLEKLWRLRTGGTTTSGDTDNATRYRPSSKATPGDRKGTLDQSLGTPGPVDTRASIGRYRLIRQIGEGGMGTVYEAEDTQLQRCVALKIPLFKGSDAKQEEMRLRFLREARAAAIVDHPNVCKVYDVGEQDSRPFVVMAFVDGGSLADRLQTGRRVKARDAVKLTMRIANGLVAVHAHGIVHRDLKPANILMTKANEPVLTDFGLARVSTDSHLQTSFGVVLGTPAYLAPEQAIPSLGPLTPQTDLYSLGVILFQLMTGRLPVDGGLYAIFAHHFEGNAAPLVSQFLPSIDPTLEAIVAKAMARRPEDRYPDMRAFLEALRGWLRAPETPVSTLPEAPTRPSAPEGSDPWRQSPAWFSPTEAPKLPSLDDFAIVPLTEPPEPAEEATAPKVPSVPKARLAEEATAPKVPSVPKGRSAPRVVKASTPDKIPAKVKNDHRRRRPSRTRGVSRRGPWFWVIAAVGLCLLAAVLFVGWREYRRWSRTNTNAAEHAPVDKK
jgi:serine/threonine protein kinase